MREQDLYRDMLKYRTGADEEGNSRFAVPLEADEDGLLGDLDNLEILCGQRDFMFGKKSTISSQAIRSTTLNLGMVRITQYTISI